ncbi:hypothetical protein C8Q72DRAFT_950064 [Fomitopsis betulina]|nr:hypothetical protein C8Q72DRAFT_950064 [Fomitopsis betulina]
MPDFIVLNLLIDQPPPEQVPYQLTSYISAEAWQARLRAVIRKGSRYINPRFDVVWAAVSFILTIVFPIAMFYVALNVLPLKTNGTNVDVFRAESNRIWQARGISFAVFIGIVLFLWAPMWFFKVSGKKRVNQMLERFEQEDRAVKPTVTLPTYRISRPRFMTNSITLTVSVPDGAAQPSTFAYGAPLPTYIINRPADPNAVAYGYGQPPAGVPMTGVPLFNQFDEKIPGYSVPAPGLYIPDETKRERENPV